MIVMLHSDFFPALQLEKDGDFMYLIADAAAVAVSIMTLAVTFNSFPSLIFKFTMLSSLFLVF